MKRSTSEIVGNLLAREKQGIRFKSENAPKPNAVQRRLLSQREEPINTIVRSIDKKEAAAREAAMVIPGSDDHSTHDYGISGDTAGPISEAEFNRRLKRMMDAAPGSVTITSGKRSTQRQTELWNAALKKYGSAAAARKWVAPPGKSKHEHGLAADLKFASPELRKWYHENAKNYGLYFPMSHEPWHIQFLEEYKGTQSAPQSTPAKVNTATPVGGGIIQKAPGRFYTGNPHVDFIIDGESNGIPTAQNPTSSAFGIGQMIKANREAYGKRFGFNPNTTNPQQQITMMMAYIKDRYKTPEAAAAFKRKHGWY